MNLMVFRSAQQRFFQNLFSLLIAPEIQEQICFADRVNFFMCRRVDFCRLFSYREITGIRRRNNRLCKLPCRSSDGFFTHYAIRMIIIFGCAFTTPQCYA